MSERVTAEIISFPRPPSALGGSVLDGPARLDRALGRLRQALAEQAEAVAGWRAALGELQGRVGGLGASLARYDAGLGALGRGVARLHAEAGRLGSWADAVRGPDQPAPRSVKNG